jgi:hypothetical protein
MPFPSKLATLFSSSFTFFDLTWFQRANSDDFRCFEEHCFCCGEETPENKGKLDEKTRNNADSIEATERHNFFLSKVCQLNEELKFENRQKKQILNRDSNLEPLRIRKSIYPIGHRAFRCLSLNPYYIYRIFFIKRAGPFIFQPPQNLDQK